jgi:hypothetical protein
VQFRINLNIDNLLKNPVGKMKKDSRGNGFWNNNADCISSATNVILFRQTDGSFSCLVHEQALMLRCEIEFLP